MGKKHFILFYVVAALSLFFFTFFSASIFAEQLGQAEGRLDDEVLIILNSSTISQMQSARRAIEEAGGVLECIIPPNAFIGRFSSATRAALADAPFIKQIFRAKVDPEQYFQSDLSMQEAVFAWNKRFEPQEESADVLSDNASVVVNIPGDLPKSKAEKVVKNNEYLRRSRAAGLKGKSEGNSVSFGRAYGAGYYDTSLYLAGDIAVGVFFSTRQGATWSSTEMTSAFSSLVTNFDRFAKEEPNTRATFTIVKETDSNNIPLKFPETLEERRNYVNDLRKAYNTHWGIVLIIDKSSQYIAVDYLGPSATFQPGFSYSTLFRRLFFLFGAKVFNPPVVSPVLRSGYLNVVNANSGSNDGKGYFGGAGEANPNDIMIPGGYVIGVYTMGQLGMRDSDGTGIPDPLDTFPRTRQLLREGGNPFIYTGKVIDIALKNEFPAELNLSDVTINAISKVEYRLNGGAWILAEPKDGGFDSAEEEFSFVLPSLERGKYLLEVRATNSVGNTEKIYTKDEFMVENNVVINTKPFAVFSVTPSAGSTATNFFFDASESSDIKNDTFLLQVRWDFENDGTWDTDFTTTKTASFTYASPGEKTVKVEVKDTQGLSAIFTRQLTVGPTDLLPVASFTVSPTNYHSNVNPFTVRLDPLESFDPEDGKGIKVRWDFNGDRIWDTDYQAPDVILQDFSLAVNLKSVSFPNISGAYDIAVAGKYAYVACGIYGFKIFDISNPQSPVFLGKLVVSENNTRAVYVKDRFAYIADSAKGLWICNIEDPRTPVLVSVAKDQIVKAYDVCVIGNYAYLADLNYGLRVVDISNPVSAKTVGSFQVEGSVAWGVFAAGDYVYVAAGYTQGLQIIDVSNPNEPVLSGKLDTPGRAGDVYVEGNYAFVSDFLKGLQVINVSDPHSPVLVSNYKTGGYVNKVFVYGQFAYIIIEGKGMQVIDISNVNLPILVAQYEFPGAVYGIFVSGDCAYLAYNNARLHIIDISQPFKQEVALLTRNWRVTLEAMDNKGNKATAVRNVWAVTYNHPPTIEKIAFAKQGVNGSSTIIAQAIGVNDPDLNTTWDGLLEYRWDFDDDGNWDTRFSDQASITVPESFSQGSTVVCQVQDRFGARCQAQAALDTLPPSGSFKINNGAAYARNALVKLNFTVSDYASGMGEGAKVALSNDAKEWQEFGYVTQLPWRLSPGDGEKSVYAKFMDAAGNYSEPCTAKVFFDCTLPDIGPAQTRSLFKRYNTEISVKIIDRGAGIKKASLYWYGYNRPYWAYEEIPLKPRPDSTFYAEIPYRRWISSYRYYIVAWDNAGNIAYSRPYYHPPVD